MMSRRKVVKGRVRDFSLWVFIVVVGAHNAAAMVRKCGTQATYPHTVQCLWKGFIFVAIMISWSSNNFSLVFPLDKIESHNVTSRSTSISVKVKLEFAHSIFCCCADKHNLKLQPALFLQRFLSAIGSLQKWQQSCHHSHELYDCKQY